MKIKLIAAAVMALCSSASFATTLACDTSSAVNMVNTCAVEAKLFIAGSSALGGALGVVVTADLFDTTTVPLIKIVDTGSPNGTAIPSGGTAVNAVTAYYGMSKAAVTGGVSKRLFVVYNKQNGSAAGVSQLLAKLDGKITEASVVSVGPLKGVVGSCSVASLTSTTAAPVLNCPSYAMTQVDLAISDVAPAELYAVYPTAAGGKLTTLTTTPLAMQGFGLMVNAPFYAALLARNVTDGLVPSTCTPSDTTFACQATIRKSDYASLISKQGTIKSAAGFIPNDTTLLTLARRDDLSGTQAASNIFFADNSCGSFVTAKGIVKPTAGILGGELDLISSTTTGIDSTKLIVQSNATGGGVTTALASQTGYAIGALSLTTAEPTYSATSARYVKIDGASPNLKLDVTGQVTKNRTNFANGDYPFAMTAFAVTVTSAVDAAKFPLVAGLTQAVISGMKDSTLHNLTGIAYLDGGVALQQSKVVRTAGNNCSPLIK